MTEIEAPSRKRTHEEYFGAVAAKREPQVDIKMEPSATGTSVPPHLATTSVLSSPVQSSPVALTDAGVSTPVNDPASPSTPSQRPFQLVVQPAQTNGPASAQSPITTPATMTLPTGQGPPKKKKQKHLTPEEQAAKDLAGAAKRAKHEKIMQQKEQKRVEKEKKKEEADRKARAQPKIANFFAKKEGATPKAEKTSVVDTEVKATSPSPAAGPTDYGKVAIPFFVHQSVKLAKSAFAMDDETREAKTQILTDYLAGKRSPVNLKPFEPMTSLSLVAAPVRRGKSHPRVKDLMAEQDGGISNPIDLIAESLSLPTRESLKSIPVKQLRFHEDVRPAYYGTITSVQSVTTLRKMARNPLAKELPLNYDYDSEAEWVQGDEEEDEEGLDEMSEDEEEEDDDKSIDEFLDDADDVRGCPLIAAGSMEPETSGICFEDRTRRNPNPQMYKFRMEFMIPNLEHHHSIDPFSNAYWPSETKAVTSAVPAGESSPNGTMRPPPAPKPASGAAAASKPEPGDLVPANQLDDFKAAILEFKFLPKSALVPTLKKKFDRCTSSQIKTTLDHVAEKPQKRGDWKLKENV